MHSLTEFMIWTPVPVAAAIIGWAAYRYMARRAARREATLMTRALAVSHALFTALEHVPDALINRELRRGVVLLLTHQLKILRLANGLHPHLRELQARVAQLNRIPSGMQRMPLRSKVARRHASLALEEIAKLLKDAINHKVLDQKTGSLAHASATFAAQQVAVETARQAAKDAENVRAYGKALSLAHQARALCRRLPPLAGKVLLEAVSDDIERLESLAGHPG